MRSDEDAARLTRYCVLRFWSGRLCVRRCSHRSAGARFSSSSACGSGPWFALEHREALP
jgi:hypothetical protein